MAIVGTAASWIAALLAACAFGAGFVTTPPGDQRRRWGELALLGSAAAAAIATVALVQLLLAGDVTVSYVARSITRNLPASYRVAALWQLPAGSVLPTAALAALAGALVSWCARTALGVAAVGTVVLALLATSLAARAFATLPWVPGDGLGLVPALQHPLSVASRLAIALAVAVSAAATALAADDSALPQPRGARGARNAHDARVEELLSASVVVLLAFAMWGGARGVYATGVAPTPAAVDAFSGLLVAPMVAAGLTLLTSGDGTARLASWLGTLGLVANALLRGVDAEGGAWALQGFAWLSLGAAASGALASARRNVRAREPRDDTRDHTSRLAPSLLTGSIALLVVGAALSLLPRAETVATTRDLRQWALMAGLVLALAASFETPSGATLAATRPRWARRGALLLALTLGVAAGIVIGMAPGALQGVAPGAHPTTSSPTLGAALASPGTWWGGVAAVALLVTASALASAATVRARAIRASYAGAIACLAFAAAGEAAAVTIERTVASGGRTTVVRRFGSPVTLVHQGVSQFEDENAHVAAVALEPMVAGRARALLSPDRREYVDSRDEIITSPLARPAVLRFPFEEIRIVAEEFGTLQQVRMRITVVVLASLWGGAVLLVTGALLAQLATTGGTRMPHDASSFAFDPNVTTIS
ncbi:MAG: hypothetical protein IT359_12465 [Gemmatimonadaceae bacterium]|nr:hypothetical protein [Gemmatimonadaceae bacterium]